MFSVQQKRQIASKLQQILRDTGHPELPEGEITFALRVEGAEPWSWAEIKNNGAVPSPEINPWNEAQAKRCFPEDAAPSSQTSSPTPAMSHPRNQPHIASEPIIFRVPHEHALWDALANIEGYLYSEEYEDFVENILENAPLEELRDHTLYQLFIVQYYLLEPNPPPSFERYLHRRLKQIIDDNGIPAEDVDPSLGLASTNAP